MALKSANELELGFFIATLLEFARDPRMGGHQAHNCGLVSGSWDVKTWPAKALAPITIGRISPPYTKNYSHTRRNLFQNK